MGWPSLSDPRWDLVRWNLRKIWKIDPKKMTMWFFGCGKKSPKRSYWYSLALNFEMPGYKVYLLVLNCVGKKTGHFKSTIKNQHQTVRFGHFFDLMDSSKRRISRKFCIDHLCALLASGFAIITWNDPKKLGRNPKPSPRDNTYRSQSLGARFSHVTVGAKMVGPRVWLDQK